MKENLRSLKVGDHLFAEIHEVLSRHECIVSLNGDLVRVRNESLVDLQPFQRVRVRVSQLSPMALQIVGERHERGGFLRLDVSI